jgi:hypothetical protein
MEFKLNSFYIINKFDEHPKVKEELLKEINNADCDSLINKDNYYSDNINRLDWNQNTDFERKWVKLIYDKLNKFFNITFKELGYEDCIIRNIWFQQYTNKGTHGWHTHGFTFTGAYYLDLPKDTPVTQIIYPYQQNKIINLNVQEGNISIFPSYCIHRSPINLSNLTKTIISFNLEIGKPTKDILNKIDLLRDV